jgi:hypothetical protein
MQTQPVGHLLRREQLLHHVDYLITP